MRIAMIGRALPRAQYAGGVSGQMHLLADALARRGHQVTAFSLNPPPEPTAYDFRVIPVPPSLLNHPRLALYLAPWWVSRIPLDDFDIVHAHGDDHFLRTHRAVVRTFYGTAREEARYSAKLRHKLYHLSVVPFESISKRRATVVVAISMTTQRSLKCPAVIIPCAYDPAVFSPGRSKSANPSILFVGDLGTRKRGDWLVEVFTRFVKRALPEAELWMVTTESISAPGVRWFGRVPTTALAELYRSAWIFCLPSRYEGFGVPYLEAMGSGTSVVATQNGGAEEVLDGGRSGRIVGDDGLGAELVALLGDNATRASFVAKGLERARHYEISRIAEQYEDLYRNSSGLSKHGGAVEAVGP